MACKEVSGEVYPGEKVTPQIRVAFSLRENVPYREIVTKIEILIKTVLMQ